ncbi:hypothetical protein TNCV_2329591 [Trichonephila clavipes]|nr:hypothetical protein TNCV_2329591 [Trichonephila clavipes]
MQYQCILGIDFMKASRLTLDFDQKSFDHFPDHLIKQMPKEEKKLVDIDLTESKLDDEQQRQLKALFNNFKSSNDSFFVEENHENWDQFLHEFAFALRTAVNETANKTPAELFLGRKIITPFSKLINVTEDAKYVGVESITGPSKLPDRRTATTTGGSRMEVSGRDNQTRQTRATTSFPVRSNQTNTRRPCPYYLRSRIQEKDGIPEELSNIEIQRHTWQHIPQKPQYGSVEWRSSA